MYRYPRTVLGELRRRRSTRYLASALDQITLQSPRRYFGVQNVQNGRSCISCRFVGYGANLPCHLALLLAEPALVDVVKSFGRYGSIVSEWGKEESLRRRHRYRPDALRCCRAASTECVSELVSAFSVGACRERRAFPCFCAPFRDGTESKSSVVRLRGC